MATTESLLAIGIDLGGSSVKAVAVTPLGQTLRHANRSFDPRQHMEWAGHVRAVVSDLQAINPNASLRIGLSAPGLAARDQRSIAYMPGRLDGLVGLDWAQFLGAPPFVPVLNDAHAALLGECWLGAARGLRNVIMLTLGTGVGGAAMVDGQLLRGHTGKAGHLGHTCLDIDGPPDVCGIPGSLEMAIGNCTILERTNGRFRTTHDLLAACEAGDNQAREVWRASLRALACAIGSFTNILDPEAVVIGGGIARAGAALFEPLEPLLRQVEWKVCGHEVKLLAAELGELAGAYGAARSALDSAA